MKYKFPLALLIISLLQGCVYYYPVNSRDNVEPVIGKKVETIRPLYLAKKGREYLLMPHDGLYEAPSFEDFEAGKWKYSHWKHLHNYKEIVPSNTAFVISTIWEEFHMEIGDSYMVYGKFTDEYEGIKPRKVLLWKTMSEDILKNKDTKYFSER